MKNCKHSSYERNTRDAVCYTSSRLSFIAFSDWLSTVIMKDTHICLAAKPHICLCFQIIRQLWSAVNGQWHFSHFTPPLSSSSFKIIYAFFFLIIKPQKTQRTCKWITHAEIHLGTNSHRWDDADSCGIWMKSKLVSETYCDAFTV